MLRMILRRRWKRWVHLALLLLCGFLVWECVRDLLPSLGSTKDTEVKVRKVFDHWGKDDTDINWLPSLLAKRTQEIPVVVVEEHYEVLKYWFQAADLGIIPMSKNILIHIDSHVDGAIPFDTDSLPVFRYPKSRQEIYRMMQRNDMFIVTAVLTGFIDHVIWVWPDWDAANHEQAEQNHLTIDVEMGYIEMKIPQEINRHQLDLCVCWKLKEIGSGSEIKKDMEASWECHRRNFTTIEAADGPEINRELCQIHSRGVFEIMGQASAATALRKIQQQVKQNLGVILDVDEDFFGCWSDMITMEEAGINRKDVGLISDLVSDMLFGFTAEEEQLSDELFSSLLHVVIHLKSKACDTAEGFHSENKHCLTSIEVSNYLIENIPRILTFLYSTAGQIIKLSDSKQAGFYLQNLLSFFQNLSVKQLKVLAELGICFTVSPSSRYFEDNTHFHICHGDNMPNNTLVTFHLPTDEEIITRTASLQKILSSLFQKPNLVTVCRSVRDGYTPKQFFNIIESNLLQIIALTFRSVQYENIHFDTSLLGGRVGWPHRSHTMSHRLLQHLSL